MGIRPRGDRALVKTQVNRVVTAALVVVAIVVVVVLFTGGDKPYTLTAKMVDGSQLVNGNQVRIGGLPVGTVKDIELGDDGIAEVKLSITDKQYDPLHEGTRAIVRNSSLTGVANRFLTLEPGPNSAPRIADGGDIRTIDTRATSDLDAILTTFDQAGRRYLQQFVNGTAGVFAGAEPETRKTLEYLNPALGQTRALADEISGDTPSLNRLLAKTAAVSTSLANNKDNLEQGLQGLATTLRAASDTRQQLQSTISRGPQFLRRANTTFVNARPLLDDARPLLKETIPVSRRLSTTLRLVQPLVAQTRPLLQNVRSALPDLDTTLRRIPTLEKEAVPTLKSATTAINGLTPIVDGLRPYIPDVFSGLLQSFGGKAVGYYDANGHWGRINFGVGSNSFGQNGTGLLGQLSSAISAFSGVDLGEGGTQFGVTKKCPGAAAGTAADLQNPIKVPRCDINSRLPGYPNTPANTEDGK